MCFYVYAPNAKITIQYASESITLLKNRKSEVIADLLISNDSDAEIQELNIIYPNRFFQFEEPPHNLVVSNVGEYQDITSTILDENAIYNWAYKDSLNQTSFKIIIDPNQQKQSQATDLQTLELTMPHPLDPAELLPYKGQIGGQIEIVPLNGLSYIQWLMLQRINYTVFTAKIAPAIEPHSARWVRWRFIGRSAVAHQKKNELILRFKNQLQNDYQIQGMYDVKNQFMELLHFLKANITKYSLKVDLITDMEELVEIFSKSGLSYPGRAVKNLNFSNVKILDWRLHINPDELGRLTDIVIKGSAEVIGRLPNYLGSDDKIFPVYEWKAGPSVTFSKEPDKEYSFSIFFQSKEYSWLSACVYIGSLIVIFLFLFIRTW